MKAKIRLLASTLILTATTVWNVTPLGSSMYPVKAATNTRFSTPAGAQATPAVANGKIIYVSEKKGDNSYTYTIHSINPDGSNDMQLTPGPNDLAPVWSPDGSQIAFVRGQVQPNEIVVMTADGGNQRSLTIPGESDDSPAWSPDGKQLAFVRTINEGDSSHGQIFAINADGSNPRRLTRSAETDSSPVWSPNGEKIAFLRSSRFGTSLVVIEAAGVEKMLGGMVSGFSWSPDGSKLSVSSYSEFGLYVVNADGTGPRTITNPPVNGAFDVAFDTMPSWSGDGSKIAFTRFLGCNVELVNCKGEQVWVVNADGSNPRQLTENGSGALAPSWSPDARQILSYDNDIVLIDPDNAKINNITNTNDVRELSPSWQPILLAGCADSISTPALSFGDDGGTGNIEVKAGKECSWIATTNVSWISFTSGSGSGDGNISYTVAANTGTAPRTAGIIVAGHLFTITQAGVPVRISSALVVGKKLLIFGENFDSGAVLLLNGTPQKSISDESNPRTSLIAKKAGKKVKPGDKLQVRNPNGTLSSEFTFPGA